MEALREFEIIDCHSHPSPKPETTFSWFLTFQTHDDFVNIMRNSGISRACGSCVESHDIIEDPAQRKAVSMERIVELNGAGIAFREAYPDFFIPGMCVQPHHPEESCREVERMHAKGVAWIGELCGYLMGFEDDYASEGAFAIYDLAQQLGMTVNVHMSTERLGDLDRMCKAFPRLSFVLAHPGSSKGVFLERVALVEKHPNLHMDFSGVGVIRWGMVRHAIDRSGVEKFLFGTDFPVCNPAGHAACYLAEPLSDGEREAIFAGNFKRLTGMN